VFYYTQQHSSRKDVGSSHTCQSHANLNERQAEGEAPGAPRKDTAPNATWALFAPRLPNQLLREGDVSAPSIGSLLRRTVRPNANKTKTTDWTQACVGVGKGKFKGATQKQEQERGRDEFPIHIIGSLEGGVLGV